MDVKLQPRKIAAGMMKTKLGKSLKSYNVLYFFLFLCVVYIFVFKILPAFYQIYFAFFEFSIFDKDRFAGLEYFRKVFSSSYFRRAFVNNVLFGLYMIIFYVPVPIMLSLLFNELSSRFFKRIFQTIVVIPNFLSWVVVAGIFVLLLSPVSGPVNEFLKLLGMEPIGFMTDEKWFRSVVITAFIWKASGYGTIIYMAALSSIDPQLYEASIVDGARRWKQVWYITLPALKETIMIVFLLQVSNTFISLTDPVLIMYNPLVYSVADVLGTYSYRQGLVKFNFSESTVINLVGAVLSFIIFQASNMWSKKVIGRNLM